MRIGLQDFDSEGTTQDYHITNWGLVHSYRGNFRSMYGLNNYAFETEKDKKNLECGDLSPHSKTFATL